MTLRSCYQIFKKRSNKTLINNKKQKNTSLKVRVVAKKFQINIHTLYFKPMQHIFAKVSYFNIADVQRQDPFFSGIKKKSNSKLV